MAMSHLTQIQNGGPPLISAVAETIFQPLNVQCKQITAFPRDSGWTEFDVPCQFPVVQNNTGVLIFSAKDTTACNIELFNTNTNATLWITVGNLQTQPSSIYNAWNCACSGPCNLTSPTPLANCVVNFNPYGIVDVQAVAPISSNIPN